MAQWGAIVVARAKNITRFWVSGWGESAEWAPTSLQSHETSRDISDVSRGAQRTMATTKTEPFGEGVPFGDVRLPAPPAPARFRPQPA